MDEEGLQARFSSVASRAVADAVTVGGAVSRRIASTSDAIDRRWVCLLALAIFLAFPAFSPGDYWIRILGLVGIYVMLGLGLNTVVGLAGLLDIGYAAFFGVGAYTYAIFASQQLDIHVSFWLVAPLAALTAAALGAIFAIPALRMRGDYLSMVTIAWGEIAYILFTNLDRPVNITNGPNGIIRIDAPSIFGHSLDDPLHIGSLTLNSNLQFYYLILVFAVLVIIYSLRLKDSRVGRAWLALREDELVAEVSGVNRVRYKLLAFALGAAVAGFSGAVFAAWLGSAFPISFTITQSVLILVIVILGGMGSIPGIVIAAFILTILPEYLQQFDLYRRLIYGVLLIAIMIYRPQGLFSLGGGRRRGA